MIPVPYLIGGSVLAVLALAGFVYLKGVGAGEAGIKSEIQTETIRSIEDARKSKEQSDEAIRSLPYDDRVEQLR